MKIDTEKVIVEAFQKFEKECNIRGIVNEETILNEFIKGTNQLKSMSSNEFATEIIKILKNKP